MEEMKNVEELNNLGQAPNTFNGLIPVMTMRITGDENTPQKYRTSHAQIAFITPEQWPEFEMRSSDLTDSLFRMGKENAKDEKIEIDPDK